LLVARRFARPSLSTRVPLAFQGGGGIDPLVFLVIAIFVAVCIGTILLCNHLFKRDPNKPQPKWKTMTQEQHNAQIKESWSNLVNSWRTMSPDEKKELLTKTTDLVSRIVPIQKVVTFPGCVVTYEPAALYGFDHAKIEEKLTAILQANPNADLTQYEQALGIKIVKVQRKGDSADGGIWV
jgi:hypothetical protein